MINNDTTDKQDYFLYTKGQERWDILRDVTHVRVHPSVKAIKDYAFWDCRQLVTVILGNSLEEIGEGSFGQCTSFLIGIIIPPTIKARQSIGHSMVAPSEHKW